MTQLSLPPFFRGHELFNVRAEANPWHITDPKIPKHWDWTGAGEGILIGIADSGIDEDHPDIAGRIDHAAAFSRTRYRDKPDYYDGNDHGTHVATMVARMVPKSRFAIGKALSDNGAGRDRKIVDCVSWLAESGCHVINHSYGSAYDNPIIRDVFAYAKGLGCLMVCATGNEGANAVGFPAQHGVGVGAVDRGLRHPSWSNTGSKCDLVGFGVDILAGIPGGQWQLMSGTSMATPWITAIAALRLSAELKHLGKIVTNSDQRLLELETFVTDLGPEGRDTSYGRGMPDLEKCFYQNLPQPEPTTGLPGAVMSRVELPNGDRFYGMLQKERSGPE